MIECIEVQQIPDSVKVFHVAGRTLNLCKREEKLNLICLVSVDSVNDPVVLALNATSAALATSPIPWDGGPLGAVRVGYIEPTNRKGKGGNNGHFVINPKRRDLFGQDNLLTLVVAGTARGHTVMLEADAKNLDQGLVTNTAFPVCFIVAIKLHIQSKAIDFT